MIPIHLFTPQKIHEWSVDSFRQPLATFLLTCCENGDPTGAMTLDRLRAAFILWFYDFMAPVYCPLELSIKRERFISRVFERLLRKTLSFGYYELGLNQEGHPFNFKNQPIMDRSAQPRLRDVTAQHIPCIFGLRPRGESVRPPPAEMYEIQKVYPPTLSTSMGIITHAQDGFPKFTDAHWMSAPRIVFSEEEQKTLVQNDLLTERIRTRIALRNKFAATKIYAT